MTKDLTNLYHDIKMEAIRILQWWRQYAPDYDQGGFIGEISQENTIHKSADKGSVLNARILWTFSAAYRKLGQPEDLVLATRAFQYIVYHFYDKERGGIYWSLKPDGAVSDSRKQIYAIAFTIYGLSEYFKITGDHQALGTALELYHAIEYYSHDPEFAGYFEAYDQDWQLLDDLRLSEKDRNDPKTMNTHLHIIEAYTNLYLIWREPQLKVSIHRLLEVFEKKIVHSSHHLSLFFDKGWNPTTTNISYGHDIEAAWLLYDSAVVLADPVVTNQWTTLSLNIVDAATEGLQNDGSFVHEYDPTTRHIDTHREWWVNAEGMIGYLHAYTLTRDDRYLQKVYGLWDFTKKHLLDKDSGEWYWGVHADYSKMKEYKMGFWKCPYHNVRACLEIMTRIEKIQPMKSEPTNN